MHARPYTLVLVCRSQILQVNGYDRQKMTEEAAEETLRELIKMSHQEFQYDATMIDHQGRISEVLLLPG